MQPRIAYELRPDLWASDQDCFMTFRKTQNVEGVQRLTVTFEGYGPVLVLARSLDNLAQRLQWIVGRPVLNLKPGEGGCAIPRLPASPGYSGGSG